jgi:ribosomal protein S18 acetylase RimI-like enzyme
MAVREAQTLDAPPSVGDEFRADDRVSFEQWLDIETEPVGHEGDRDVLRLAPLDERAEGRIQWTVIDREPEHLVQGSREHRGLVRERVATSDLTSFPRNVVVGPRRVTELDEQVLCDVVQARRPIEVHQHGADRQHRRRVAAWEHAGMDLAERIAAAGLEGERVRAEVVQGGEVVEVADLLVSLSNLPAPELNGTRVIREPDDAPEALAAAREVFRSRGHPFFGIEIEVGRHPAVEAAVRAAGLRRVDAWQTLAAPVAGLPAEPVPVDAEILDVREESDLEAVRAVEIAAFETPAEIAEGFVGRRMLEDERVRMFTAWIDGEPVGEASAYLLDDTVGIFGVGVVESARRRGIGAALTLRAARAFDDRTDLAWLQPSDPARRMYARLGFRPVSDWEVWVAKR